MGWTDRAGHNVKQSSGYQAFIPSPLPPAPPIQMDDQMYALLSKADHALGRLDGASDLLPNLDLFVYMYVRKEAVLSSQIEGTQASLLDVLEYEAHLERSDRPNDAIEIIRYISAMNYGLERLETLPVSLRLIREIHEKLLTNVRGGERNPGHFRVSQNWVGPSGSTLKTATYVPPPPPEMLQALDNLEKFLYDKKPMPFLVKVGLVHSHFETIHPFLDGNGRVGRLLITFLMVENKLLSRPLLYLSFYFKKNRAEYYNRLQAVRDRGDFEGWLKFFLQGVYEVSEESSKTIREITRIREEHRALVAQTIQSSKAQVMLEHLLQNPIISVSNLADTLGASYASANNLLAQFVKLGLLSEETGNKRYRRFAYRPYLDIFSDPPAKETIDI